MTVKEFIQENFAKTIRNNTEDIPSATNKDYVLLGLPFPYTVPCTDNKFLEMYYWDTYFTNVGLIADGNIELAKSNIDNMLWLVDKYGLMPNGNLKVYLNRSQPPFLYLGVKDIYNVTGDKNWLSKAYDTLCKEYDFWQTNRLAPNGLNFYGNHTDIDPETIEKLYKDYSRRTGGFATDNYELKCKAAHSVRTFVESGWDCNSRFGIDGEFFNPVDLNSLLYGFEKQMSEFSKVTGKGEEELWSNRAEVRKEKMLRFMWNEKEKLFLDYNFKSGKFSTVISAASVYPAFTGITCDKNNTNNLMNRLLLKYGVSASAPGKDVKGFQWDYPNIWPPVQYIAYKACINCGLYETAKSVRDRYINLIDTSFGKTNNLWEKYDGNTGEVANQDYNAPAMMGWTSGVYLYFENI